MIGTLLLATGALFLMIDVVASWWPLQILEIAAVCAIQLYLYCKKRHPVERTIPLILSLTLMVGGLAFAFVPYRIARLGEISWTNFVLLGIRIIQFALPIFAGVELAFTIWLIVRFIRFLIRRFRPNTENNTP